LNAAINVGNANLQANRAKIAAVEAILWGRGGLFQGSFQCWVDGHQRRNKWEITKWIVGYYAKQYELINYPSELKKSCLPHK
jgi:hypothetical protein